MNLRKILAIISTIALVPALSACNSSDDSASVSTESQSLLPDTTKTDPSNPTESGDDRNYATEVMLFNGVGISTSDWQTTEQIIKSAGITYKLVNSAQLNAMSLDEMSNFGLMVFPGGYGNQITNGLTAATRIRVRQAVRDNGVSFLGICAGAWVTVGPDPGSNAASYGFAIVTGSILNLYYPEGVAPTADMVDVSFSDNTKRSLVWWGGPYTPEWSNGVVARYKTGEPAISQTYAGKGFVVVSGPHPEAPQGWRATAGTDSDGLDYDIALNLIKAALNRQPLPTF